MKIVPIAASAAALFGLALPASAEPVTFAEALAEASAGAPQLQASALRIQAQQSASVAAGQLPDPKVGVAVENFPVSGPPAFNHSRDEMTMLTLSASQEIPSAAKRQAQRTRAAADIGEAQASLALSAREVRVQTALAWLDLAFAERRLAAIDEGIAKLASYESASTAGVASGGVRPAQSLEVRRAVAVLQDQRAELEAQRGRAAAALARWTGNADPQTVGPVPQFQLDPAQLGAAIDRNPRLQATDARIKLADADIELAKAQKRPDLAADIAYHRRDPSFGDMVSVGVTVTLPLFASKRQDPVISAKTAAAAAAVADQEDARRALHAELQAALADHMMHHEQLERAQSTLLPLAQQQSELETASYAAGRATLADVIAARKELVDAKLMLLDRELMVARDGAAIALTYGDDQ